MQSMIAFYFVRLYVARKKRRYQEYARFSLLSIDHIVVENIQADTSRHFALFFYAVK